MINELFDRIESEPLNPVWISLAPRDQALAHATEVAPNALLAGLTFAVKDNIDVAGIPTTAGCPAFAYTPSETAPVVDCLQAGGATLIGKTNMDQFATGLVGTRTPYGACSSVFGEEYISGGSSSGSAVAVAKGLVDFSLGTDTAGSGRVPAAFNGLIGVKPSRGLLSTRGVVPACRSLDCVSIFARSIDTARRVFEAAARFDPADPFSRQPRTGERAAPWVAGPFRFGVPRAEHLEFFGDHEAAELYRCAIAQVKRVGGEAVEIDFGPFRDAAALLYSGPWVAERSAAIEPFLRDHADEMDPTVRKIISGAERYTAVDAFRAQYRLQELRRNAEEQWRKMDVLFLPTTGTIFRHSEISAEPIQPNTDLGYYTNFVNLMDLAALAVPAGFRSNGLPFGVSFIGQEFTDEALLTLASRYLGEAAASTLPDCIPVAVVGAHLTGQPLNWQLTTRGARLLRACRTAPGYRLYALRNTQPAKPGLVRAPEFEGPGIEVEVWAVPAAEFGGFVADVPPPLGIGNATLEDGTSVKAFICEQFAVDDAQDITALGGWRKHLELSKT